jgi:hypothetical protein
LFNKTIVGAGRGGGEMAAREKSCRRRGGLVLDDCLFWVEEGLDKAQALDHQQKKRNGPQQEEGLTSLKAMRRP